jgi:hypothetical protein
MSDQTTTKHTATRWLAYTGAPVMTCLPGLHPDNIDLIVDLSTLTVAASVIPALREHGTPVGTWSNVTIDKSRGVIADLALLQAPPESEGLAMFDAARELRMSIDRGIPWQASIGAKPDPNSGSYDPVLTPTLINGRTQTPNADGTPMFVLRRGVLIEISIVLWGADAQTHQLPTALTAPAGRCAVSPLYTQPGASSHPRHARPRRSQPRWSRRCSEPPTTPAGLCAASTPCAPPAQCIPTSANPATPGKSHVPNHPPPPRPGRNQAPPRRTDLQPG